jgi:hypothetical protein
LSNVPVPQGHGKPDVTLTIDVQNERDAIVHPYPFDVSPLPLAFEGRLVFKQSYAKQEEFLENFYSADRIGISYKLSAA